MQCRRTHFNMLKVASLFNICTVLRGCELAARLERSASARTGAGRMLGAEREAYVGAAPRRCGRAPAARSERNARWRGRASSARSERSVRRASAPGRVGAGVRRPRDRRGARGVRRRQRRRTKRASSPRPRAMVPPPWQGGSSFGGVSGLSVGSAEAMEAAVGSMVGMGEARRSWS